MRFGRLKRREFILALGGAAAWPLVARAQQTAVMRKIGFLGAASPNAYADRVQAFQAGLRELGYVDGKNVEIHFRWAEGDYNRLPELASELLNLPVDVLVTHGTPGTLAAKRATTTTPIVMAVSGDAVATGLVRSLSHPGDNITGSTYFNPELVTKRLELAKEAVPSTVKMGLLFNSNNSSDRLLLKTAEEAGQPLNLEIVPLPIRTSDDIATILSPMRNRLDAVTVTDDGVVLSNAQAIAVLSREIGLPLYGFKEITHAGGLIGYSANVNELFRRAAVFVDKILRGIKPADVPVEQPTRFELVINMKTAKALQLQLPDTLLARADEIIE
jgi:putative tryptophan/tyrosine transport system substrate-binding protein